MPPVVVNAVSCHIFADSIHWNEADRLDFSSTLILLSHGSPVGWQGTQMQGPDVTTNLMHG